MERQKQKKADDTNAAEISNVEESEDMQIDEETAGNDTITDSLSTLPH